MSISEVELETGSSMALTLKDKETDRLAREVATLTGETLTDAIRKALAERPERECLRRGQSTRLADRLMEIGRHCAALPDLDTRSRTRSSAVTKPARGAEWWSIPRRLSPSFWEKLMQSVSRAPSGCPGSVALGRNPGRVSLRHCWSQGRGRPGGCRTSAARWRLRHRQRHAAASRDRRRSVSPALAGAATGRG